MVRGRVFHNLLNPFLTENTVLVTVMCLDDNHADRPNA